MKTKLFPAFVIAASVLALGAQAQEQVADTTAAPQPTQVVYSPRLPSAAELSNVAAAQGLTIDKIIQTSSQMTLVYRTASGQTNTVAYMLLPAAGSAPSGTPATVSTTTVAAPSTPAPQVVYTPPPAPPQVVYYTAPAPAPVYYSPYYYPAYYSSPWYTPVSVSLGFGFGYYGGNYYRGGGHYHGGGHGGGHGRH